MRTYPQPYLLPPPQESGFADEVFDLLGLHGVTAMVEGLNASLDFTLQLLEYCKVTHATSHLAISAPHPSSSAPTPCPYCILTSQ